MKKAFAKHIMTRQLFEAKKLDEKFCRLSLAWHCCLLPKHQFVQEKNSAKFLFVCKVVWKLALVWPARLVGKRGHQRLELDLGTAVTEWVGCFSKDDFLVMDGDVLSPTHNIHEKHVLADQAALAITKSFTRKVTMIEFAQRRGFVGQHEDDLRRLAKEVIGQAYDAKKKVKEELQLDLLRFLDEDLTIEEATEKLNVARLRESQSQDEDLANFDLDSLFEVVSEQEKKSIKDHVDKAVDNVAKRGSKRAAVSKAVKKHFGARPETTKARTKAQRRAEILSNLQKKASQKKPFQCQTDAQFLDVVNEFAPLDVWAAADKASQAYRIHFPWTANVKTVSWTERGHLQAAKDTIRKMWDIYKDVREVDVPFDIESIPIEQMAE